MNFIKKYTIASLAAVLLAALTLSADEKPDLRTITVLATNDIHGGIEPQAGPNGTGLTGGLAIFSGAVKAIKQGLQQKYADKAGVLVVDAGDQFQGTLISNYTEGSLIFSAMNDVGYDAAITGNHDYDFGPHGWLVDSVKDQDPANPDQDPRGVIKELASKASFPILSANTYYRASLADSTGKTIDAASAGCVPKDKTQQIDWTKAKHPEFLKPYLIKEVAGVRVALVGLDNPATPTMTTPDNVTDLCFRDEAASYEEVREQLEGKADVFVIIVHDGNSNNEFNGSNLASQLYAYSPKAVDAIVAGHTHFIHNVRIGNIPVIQSGHGGERFGRIDIVYNATTGAVEHDKVTSMAGGQLDYAACDQNVASFCQVLPDQSGVSYEGVPVVADQKIVAKIAAQKEIIAPMAGRVLGEADAPLTVDRIAESSLADALTDSFREISHADVAIMNTGGLRTDLKQGLITYSDLFEVIPFNNHGYVVGPMPAAKLIALLTRSIQTCGSYGALMQSGLKVSFSRNCAQQPVDSKAQLLHVETLAGEIVLDTAKGVTPSDGRIFNVATLDFLTEGGSGYTDFIGTPLISDLGVIREVLSNALALHPAHWSGGIDNRWLQVGAGAANP